jgi:serine phosphatase RsbU (regulator of sigma subunit)
LVKNGEVFANQKIYFLKQIKPNLLIGASREKGFFTIELSTNNDAEKIEFIETQNNLICSDFNVYCGEIIDENTFAIGTLSAGVFILNLKGEIISQINEKTGIKSQVINALYLDHQKGLWIASDKGIARYETNKAFAYYNSENGLQGDVRAVAKFNNELYVGTNLGLYKIVDGKIGKEPIIKAIVFGVKLLKFDAKQILIVTTERATYVISTQSVTKLNDEFGYCVVQSKFDKNYIYIGTTLGLTIYHYQNNQLNFVKNNADFCPEIKTIVEDNNKNIWIGTAYNGIVKLKSKSSLLNNISFEVDTFGTAAGLPSLAENRCFFVGDQVLFGTINGIYTFNSKTQKFSPFNYLGLDILKPHDQVYQMYETPNNNVWLFRSNSLTHDYIYINRNNKSAKFPLKRMSDFDAYECVFSEDSAITWFGGTDGLFKFDSRFKSNDNIAFNTIIRLVVSKNDTLFAGYFSSATNGLNSLSQGDGPIPALLYKNNNVNFEFAGLSFDNEKSNEYSYKLVGFDNDWSGWGFESNKNYTNLPEGEYIFTAKCKNIYGKISTEATFKFSILPPWYRTSWAYLGYFILSTLIIYVITQLSIRRLKDAKNKLELVVKERTAEVVAEKEEVEKQKRFVEIKNKDITDSINYAQRIQQAILPLPEDFLKVFPQSFIYFQPRDIVSGDFYWFNKPIKANQNWVYIAAADCTGHGVPGAFMSMIGNTLLNEIVNEKEVYETDEILNILHQEIRSSLKQDKAQTENNDGMDIALCRINLDTLELQYSGANRPLYIFSENDNGYAFKDVKPDKFPIGGFQAEAKRSFTKSTMLLNKNDSFYIFSDGYADQFGGPNGKKFMVKRFYQELLNMQTVPIIAHAEKIKKLHTDWKADLEQVDDILVIGVKL